MSTEGDEGETSTANPTMSSVTSGNVVVSERCHYGEILPHRQIRTIARDFYFRSDDDDIHAGKIIGILDKSI